MATTLITRREAAELSGTSETTVKKALDGRVIPARRRGAQSWIEYEDVPVLAMLEHLRGLGLQANHKRRVREWLRTADAAPELALTAAVVVRKLDAVDEARDRAARYVRLRDEWIVRDPAIK